MEQRFSRDRRGLGPAQEAELQQKEHLVRELEERHRIEQEQVIFSTQIENSVIAKMSEIGVYPYAVYSVIKMYQASGEDDPSYAKIADMTGINRSTVIRSVKKLKDLDLLSPQKRFNQDGGQTSNRYNLQSPDSQK